MGADTFRNTWSGKDAESAFNALVQDALYQHGHAGYSGTVAEKESFVMIATVKTRDEAVKLADKLIEDGDERIDDKWGPAGCIEYTEKEKGWRGRKFIFFGWASS